MKILLDENLPAKLTIDFGPGFDLKTAHEMGWIGKKNGELLGLMLMNSFDFFVTLDKSLKHQQNLEKFDVSIFILQPPNYRPDTLQASLEKVKEKILSGKFHQLTEVG